MPDQSSDNVRDKFTPEEQSNLSYLGSMLREEPTEEEEKQQQILDAYDQAREQGVGGYW